MILFALRCAHGHEFEAWFRDSGGFEAQQRAGEIICPECSDTSVGKAVMAPRLARSREGSPPALSTSEMRAALRELRRQVEARCDYVGDHFAEEARRIHYGEADPHGIYGEASDEDARALVDEGIGFGRLPWISSTDA